MNAMNRYFGLVTLLLSATGCGGAELAAEAPELQSSIEAEAQPMSEEEALVESMDTVSADGTRIVTVQVKRTGLCLDVGKIPSGSGANVRQYPCHGGDNQKFKLKGVGSDYSKLINVYSGLCLEMNGSSSPRLRQYPCDGDKNQEFRLRRQGGYYQFIVRDSGKCVEAKDTYPLPEAPITEASCRDIPTQEFKIKYQ